MYICIQAPRFLARYLGNSGHAIVVRPCLEPEGVKVFDFSWDSTSKTLHVKSPWTGRYLCRVPGTCGPRREFWQAYGFLALSGAPAVKRRKLEKYMKVLSLCSKH